MSREERRRRWALLQTFVIGKQNNPMMKRVRVIQTPWFGIYVHFIYREDLDPWSHDHPWNFWRMVLKGGYIENYSDDPSRGLFSPQMILPWRPLWFPTNHAHRITMVKPGTVSLVLVGRKQRTWGFWRPKRGADDRREWHDYREVLGLR
jgi:hypothetical protein